ncbi:hypothetical protein HDU84_002087 [Entophlyctis sp. JEL0112]|nr:hypothetical protein HDU84_002087 [Entophlyctis sp. JEL0112]
MASNPAYQRVPAHPAHHHLHHDSAVLTIHQERSHSSSSSSNNNPLQSQPQLAAAPLLVSATSAVAPQSHPLSAGIVGGSGGSMGQTNPIGAGSQGLQTQTGTRQPKRTTKTSQKQVLFPADADGEAEADILEFTDERGPSQHHQQPFNLQHQQLPYKTTQKEEFLRRVDKASLPRATAYCTCSRYNMDQLMEYLFSRKVTNGTSPRRYDEALYTPYSFSPFAFSMFEAVSSTDLPGQQFVASSSLGHSSSETAMSADASFTGVLPGATARGPVASMVNFQDPSESTRVPSVADRGNITVSNAGTLEGATSYGDFSDTIEGIGGGSYKDLVRRATVPELFFFDFGVVVMWGLTEEEEYEILEDIRPFEEESIDHNDLESEKFHYLYSRQQQARIYNDIITLISPTSSVMIKLTISYAFAQSAKLTLFEGLIEETIESTRQIPSVMAESGKIHMHRKAINKKIGQLFIMRINVNLVSNVLDTPEIFWSEPAFEPLSVELFSPSLE